MKIDHLGQHCDKQDHCKLSEENITHPDGNCHQDIPVVVHVLHTPEIGGIERYERRIEEIAVKKCHLRPERVPAVSQNSKITLVIKDTHDGGDYR